MDLSALWYAATDGNTIIVQMLLVAGNLIPILRMMRGNLFCMRCE